MARTQIASLKRARQREAERKTLNERQIATKNGLNCKARSNRSGRANLNRRRTNDWLKSAPIKKTLTDPKVLSPAKRPPLKRQNPSDSIPHRLDQAEAAITHSLHASPTPMPNRRTGKRLNDALGEEINRRPRRSLSPTARRSAGEGSALNTLGSQPRIEAELADIITAPPELEIAIAAALGIRQYISHQRCKHRTRSTRAERRSRRVVSSPEPPPRLTHRRNH